MNAEAIPVRAHLVWKRIDSYHERTECGRFSVVRVNVEPAVIYEAFRWPGTELGRIRLPADSSDAERMAAIRELRAVCEAQA